MPAISRIDLYNAKLDADHIAAIATSLLPTATDRLGHVKKTMQGAVDTIVSINNRGAWTASTSYLSKDIVSNSGTWYICVYPHTSGSTFSTDTPLYWRVYQGVISGDLAASSGASLIGVATIVNTPSIVAVLSGTVQSVLDGIIKRIAWLFNPLWTSFRQVVAPAGTPTLSLGTSGNLNGSNYAYSVTYVTADGETEAGGESATISATNQRVILTGIPVSPDASVTSRSIYRTSATSVDAVLKYKVTTIADNTTTSYTDNIADSSLGVAVPRTNTTGGLLITNGSRIAATDGDTTIFGKNAHVANTGYSNSAFGSHSLQTNGVGFRNSAFGNYALTSNTSGYENTGVGVHALNYCTSGSANTAVGYAAGFTITTGQGNTFIGDFAGMSNASSTSYNTIIGYSALQQNIQTIGKNTVVGTQSGFSNVTGYSNVFIGYNSGYRSTANNTLIIDNQDRTTESSEQSNSLIYGLFGTTPSVQFLKIGGKLRSANSSALISISPSSTQAGAEMTETGEWSTSSGSSTSTRNAHSFYNGNGLVGVIQTTGSSTLFTNLSDRRVKTKIKSSLPALDKINSIQVREFEFIKGKQQVTHGFIAQELFDICPDAVVVGSEDMPWMIDSSKLIPMLVKSIQELSERVKFLESK